MLRQGTAKRAVRVLPGLRAITLTFALLLATGLSARAQSDPGAPAIPTDPSALDQGALSDCQSILDSDNVDAFDPEYLDGLSDCYAVETASDTSLDPLSDEEDTQSGLACFAAGSVVVVTQPEIDEIMQFGRDNNRTQDLVKGDIEALNRSRGGSGSSICPQPPTTPSPSASNGGVTCNNQFASIDEAIAWEQGRVKDTEADLKSLEKLGQVWSVADKLSNWRVEFYVMDQILSAHNMGLFDPITPERKFAQIDRKYHKPRYGDFVSRDSMVLVDLNTAIPAWQASPDGQAAQAEKDAYATFDASGNLTGGSYKQKLDSINSFRSLPKNPNDVNNLGKPAAMLQDIQAQQDLDIVVLQRAQQDLNSWQQAKANGVTCSFSTGPLGQAIFAPLPKSDPLYVFNLDGIGLVIATQHDVDTTPACTWAGGGPRPCPNGKPAKVAGTFGGPYSTEADARADLKTKLVCRSGYWGPQAKVGSGGTGLAAGGWVWLQNNVSTTDCKTVS